MAIQIKHPFVSLKGDGGDATLVRPSNWNALHTTSMATNNLVGRLTAGTGSFEEIPVTAFVAGILNSADAAAFLAALGVGAFETGDVKFSISPTAASGWIAYNGEGTISKAGSGGTIRANADCLALFVAIYTSITDAFCPVSGGRTGSDAAAATNDFNSGKTIALPRFSGRTIIGAGTGASLTARAAGAYGGAETHALSTAELASHYHAAGIYDPTHAHSVSGGVYGGTSIYGNFGNFDGINAPSSGAAISIAYAATGVRVTSANGIDTTYSAGSGTGHNNMQPHVPMWVKVKL